MNPNVSPTITELIEQPERARDLPPQLAATLLVAALEQVVEAVPVADLPALLGALEKIKVIGWGRTMHGPHTGQEEHHLLTIPEVAKRLKVSEYRAYELARQGSLKSVRLGKSVRVKSSAMADYLAQQGV